jgi:voltage-gated potassium channel
VQNRAAVEWSLFFLALLLVPLILIQVSSDDPQTLAAVEIANALIWFAFVADLVYLARHASSARSFVRERWLEIAIVLLSPPFILPAEVASLRLLRILRLVRLLAVLGRLQQGTGRALGRQGLAYIGILGVFFVFVGGISIHELEPERAPTVWEGMWWAIVTLTTVGYGDISPATFEGRILAAFLMVSGLAVIGALAGSVGALFLGAEGRPTDTDRRLEALQFELREIRDLLGVREKT